MQARKRRAGCGGTVMVVVGGLIGLGLLGSLFGGDDDAEPAASLSPTVVVTAVTEAAEGAAVEASAATSGDPH